MSTLLLSGGFFPQWMIVAVLVAIPAGLVFGTLGIRYLLRKDLATSTCVLSLIFASLSFLFCHLFLSNETPSYGFFLAMPFGTAVSFALVFAGSPLLSFLIGGIANIVSILGFVRLVEKFLGKDR